MSDEPQRPDVQLEIVEKFRRQFEACDALYGWTSEHRPDHAPTPDDAGNIVLWTYARSTKTFQASLRLCYAGYGVQAGMLNRSLYEDMLIAHWVKRHPDIASERLRDHERWVLAKWGATLRRHGILQPNAQFPQLSRDERHKLGRRYRGKTWTGLNLPELLNDVRDEWTTPLDKRILAQVNDIMNRFDNILLHHGSHSLALMMRQSNPGSITFDVGPADMHIVGGLLGAFFTYANTASLVYAGEEQDELNQVYGEHLVAFVRERTS